MRRTLLAASLLAAAIATASPRPVAACSCTNNLTLQEEFDYASLVFTGRVLSIQPGFDGMVEVRFEPLQRWKGPLDYAQMVVTPPDPGACGFPFTVGEEYLVFASGIRYAVASHAQFTHLCARTSPLAGNPYIADLPPPLVTTPAARPSWGTLKTFHR